MVEIIGAHVVLAYSMMGLVIDLYGCMRVSLFLPHVVPDTALYILIVRPTRSEM